ncbi:tyrosine-type recombinase/integrase [Aurantimonas sp. DM33-3]|uniref:tyrosine-type recombinase/integrase n=1 Tax=Aurantimonas sp. DM33-3 TaxID=2766955 RepID=UPI001652525E|nr:site-specific integrase [Aurantimonas sp. DM33-3]MBC6718664.1 tyrosine-type recombinase/integrase [Aurantimonas sp. DM33-3]
MPVQKLTKSLVDRAIPNGKDLFLWDAAPKGFGLKVSASGAKTFVVQYRLAGGRAGRTRRMTIGKYGSPWTVESARKEAARILADVAGGSDPADKRENIREMPSITVLCDRYLRDGVGTKKDSTLSTDVGRIERHIKPLLGRKKVSELTRNDVMKFQNDVASGKTAVDVRTGVRGRAIVRGGKGTAARTVGLLGGILAYAVGSGLIQENPVHGVKRYKDKRNHRFLSETDIAKIGNALTFFETQNKNANAIAIVRLLLFTGARRGEIERLRWREVDPETRCLRLEDSKTGQKILPISAGASELLIHHEARFGRLSEFVFASADYGGHYSGTPKFWKHVRSYAGFPELRLHDLRHSFASLGLSQGRSLSVLGALLGHRDHGTTQRYAHLSEDPVRLATEEIGTAIARAIGKSKPGNEKR